MRDQQQNNDIKKILRIANAILLFHNLDSLLYVFKQSREHIENLRRDTIQGHQHQFPWLNLYPLGLSLRQVLNTVSVHAVHTDAKKLAFAIYMIT